MKKTLITSSFLFVFALVCLAADLNGSWQGTVKLPNGDNLELTYKMKVEGEVLKGSVVSSYGEIPLLDGKVKGEDFSFKLEFGDNKFDYNGKLYGDSIVINSKLQGVENKNTFKRVVEK
jgi:hypothetical protein